MDRDALVREAGISYHTGPTPPMATLLAADEIGLRLEVVNGLPTWEVHPGFRHQKTVDEIRQTLRRQGDAAACGCFHYADVYVQFPDGSLKWPDVAVFCAEPPITDEALTMIPAAVIEVVSAGYELKDLEIGPLFYLSQGVQDVVVVDPRTLLIMHFRKDGVSRLYPPVEIVLQCGCRCKI